VSKQITLYLHFMPVKHTVLYAEDDADDLFIVQQAFDTYNNIEVMHAGNGWEALKILDGLSANNVRPCLVILDINMPVMDGRETLERIRNNKDFHDVPVVLFTTSNSTLDRDFATRWQTELIVKPVDYSNLEGIVKKFVSTCNFEVNSVNS
jgi:CheY-like chemotaxis protein